jgi:hypothetical protein
MMNQKYIRRPHDRVFMLEKFFISIKRPLRTYVGLPLYTECVLCKRLLAIPKALPIELKGIAM